MADPFGSGSKSLISSGDSWYGVTPHNTNELPIIPKAVRVNGAGSIVLEGEDGVSASFDVAAGEMLFLRPRKVRLTGTTATGIVAIY